MRACCRIMILCGVVASALCATRTATAVEPFEGATAVIPLQMRSTDGAFLRFADVGTGLYVWNLKSHPQAAGVLLDPPDTRRPKPIVLDRRDVGVNSGGLVFAGGPSIGEDVKPVFAATLGQTIQVWQQPLRKGTRIEAGAAVSQLILSPDGRRVAALGVRKDFERQPVIGLWDTATGRQTAIFEVEPFSYPLAFSPDGERLIVGRRASRATFGDTQYVLSAWTATGTGVGDLAPVAGRLQELLFSPDGKRLLFVHTPANSGVRAVTALDAETGKQLESISRGVSGNWVESVAVWPGEASDAPLGRVAFGYRNGEVRFDVLGRLPVPASAEKHTVGVPTLVFSADGRRVASGGGDWRVKLWDTRSGRLLQTFEGHRSPIRTLAFSPDGRRLASCDAGGTAAVWALPELAAD